MPSCMRVPPDAGPASRGRPSRVARSTAFDDAFRRGEPDGSGQEAELADDHGHAAASDEAFAGEDGFVNAGLGPGRGQFLPVLGGADPGR